MHACFRTFAAVFVLSTACAAQKPVFDVVSVRISPPEAPAKGFGLLNPFLDLPPKSGLFSANLRVSDYVGFAYRINDPSQLRPVYEQMPRWSQTELYDIEARSEGTPTRDELRQMVRTVLEERFKLKVHTEARQLPVYDLVFDKSGKPGPQLRPHPADAPCEDRPPNTPGGIKTSEPPPYCGTDLYRHEGKYHLRVIDGTIEQAALALSGVAGFMGGMENLPFRDRTGLAGHFDLDLEFVAQRPADAPPLPDNEPTGPTFPDALRAQLGLKLIRQTGSVSVFLVDHVERPSEN